MILATTDAVLILCTAPNADVANSLAHHLVSNRLAACVNILANLTSIYLWQGEVCEEREQQLIIKTSKHSAAAVMQSLKNQHPYAVPEIIQLAISDGDADYLQWIKQVCA